MSLLPCQFLRFQPVPDAQFHRGFDSFSTSILLLKCCVFYAFCLGVSPVPKIRWDPAELQGVNVLWQLSMNGRQELMDKRLVLQAANSGKLYASSGVSLNNIPLNWLFLLPCCNRSCSLGLPPKYTACLHSAGLCFQGEPITAKTRPGSCSASPCFCAPGPGINLQYRWSVNVR